MPKGASATSQKSVQDARKNLTSFLKKLDTIPTEELEKSAQRIKAEAIAKVPYKTGKLERAIYVRVARDKLSRHSSLSDGGWSQQKIITSILAKRALHVCRTQTLHIAQAMLHDG